MYRTLWTVGAALWLCASAEAHFVWIAPSEQGTTIHVRFSETGAAGDAETLPHIEDIRVQRLTTDGKLETARYEKGEDSLEIQTTADELNASVFITTMRFGVMKRGESNWLLNYYAKGGPAFDSPVWEQVDTRKHLILDFDCRLDADQIRVRAWLRGEPIAGAQVKVIPAGQHELEGTTDERGVATFQHVRAGVHSVRVRVIEPVTGEHDGDTYEATRHYTTQTVTLPRPHRRLETSPLPAIPEMITSFGAAIIDGHLYTYGGHTGEPHSYYRGAQSAFLRRCKVSETGTWEVAAEGPALQGLALVAYKNRLYRVGGFEARNPKGAASDLWSTSSVAAFDVTSNTWSNLPSLPEPRSSHDAVMLGSKLVVVGGWKLHGPNEPHWHDTAWSLDLDDAQAQWTALPKPPFKRRALSIAAHGKHLYVLGGMQPKGGPTTRVDRFDTSARTWQEAPPLQGGRFEGFGSAAFALGGRLYVSTSRGRVQVLAESGDAWDVVGMLERARFFHRMLPIDATRMLLVGGADMSVGKFDEVDVLTLSE